ncbi:hypothetical protein RclHR1_23310002 [Rhizophagus clarus]|uniref:RRM domain-containing protein n=1 Tax=Rhizophagus clarus TaxID=94130 RepID=A0A2Z6QXP5_9GLOM|nr:hypothetical protein RclHR1_23310002 [Rhizophagus clarus]
MGSIQPKKACVSPVFEKTESASDSAVGLEQALTNLLNTEFEVNSKRITFKKIVSTYEQDRLDNAQSRDHTIQVHGAPLSYKVNFVKKFFECYGDIEHCYARCPNRNSLNRQIIYITFLTVEAIENFTSLRQIWAFNEFLYVTPLTLDNAQQNNIINFCIPHNTKTDISQRYAYVYFATQTDMDIATLEKKILTINDQDLEWSDLSKPSCYQYGYAGHYLRNCEYRPNKKPLNRKAYLKQAREFRNARFNRNGPCYNQRMGNKFNNQHLKSTSYADAVKRNTDQDYSTHYHAHANFKPWNRFIQNQI